MNKDEDKYSLNRFLQAQVSAYPTVLSEIRRGAKRTHWMWFIFPQLAGLGHSPIAQRYAIGSLGEAHAFLNHPILGMRYRECVEGLQTLPNADAEHVFGGIDALKLRSSLTLFNAVSGLPLLEAALARWFGGEKDPATQRILEQRSFAVLATSRDAGS